MANVNGPYTAAQIAQLEAELSGIIKGYKGLSGASSIEQSAMVASLLVPTMNFPILIPPDPSSSVTASQSNPVQGITVTERDKSTEQLMELALEGSFSLQTANDDAVSSMLDSWNKNLDEISKHIKELVNSPDYQEKLEVQLHGTPAQKAAIGDVLPLQTVINKGALDAPSAPDPRTQVQIIDSLARLQVMERVPATTKMSEVENDNAALGPFTSVIPFTAMMMVAGAVSFSPAGAAGTTAVKSEGHHLGVGSGVDKSLDVINIQPSPNIVDTVQSANPSLALALADVVPMINLMVVAPFYYSSFSEGLNSFSKNQEINQQALIQSFAQETISNLVNPDFIHNFVVAFARNDPKLSDKGIVQITATVKLVLASVALSLLYAAGVGKVQGDQFGGMTPQEFRDLLNGTLLIPDPTKQPSLADKATLRLIQLIKQQLDYFPPDQKAELIESVLQFISTPQSVKKLTTPAEVIKSYLESATYDAEADDLAV